MKWGPNDRLWKPSATIIRLIPRSPFGSTWLRRVRQFRFSRHSLWKTFCLRRTALTTRAKSGVRRWWPAETRKRRGTGNSLIFNGGFEYDAIDGGLDWHLVPIQGVNYDYDSANAHSGKRALRLTFDGAQNPGIESVYQNIPVQPNTRYHFEGYLRTSGVTTESGVRFFIAFAGSTQPPLILDNLTGDHPWGKQSADFTTAPGEYRIVVELYRPKSVRFNNNLAGTAWLDDVSIVPVEPSHPNP